MAWDFTILFVHLAALAALAALYRHGPDAIQRLVIGLLACAMLVLVTYCVAGFLYRGGVSNEAIDLLRHWTFSRMAYVIEHIAVLVYVLRLFVADQERRCLPDSSAKSPSSRPS